MFKKFFILLFLFTSFFSYAGERKILIRVSEDSQSVLYLYNETKGTIKKLASEKGIDYATFSPDGKYIAYGFVRYWKDGTEDVVIIDEEGKEFGRIIVSPLMNDLTDNIRMIKDIEWREDNIIITKNNEGPHGGDIDLWKIEKIDNSFKCSHLKRIEDVWCSYGKISPKLDYMASLCYGYDDILREGKEIKTSHFMKIFNLSKKENAEDNIYSDPEPVYLDVNAEEISDIEFISDYEVLIEMSEGKEFYIFKIKEGKLERTIEPSKKIKKKQIPDKLDIEIKGKRQHFSKGFNIFDVFEK